MHMYSYNTSTHTEEHRGTHNTTVVFTAVLLLHMNICISFWTCSKVHFLEKIQITLIPLPLNSVYIKPMQNSCFYSGFWPQQAFYLHAYPLSHLEGIWFVREFPLVCNCMLRVGILSPFSLLTLIVELSPQILPSGISYFSKVSLLKIIAFCVLSRNSL